MCARSGFSLVELSIVLVILGLLVGGILSGQALIRAAELRSVGEDIKKYSAAIFAFRGKYMALPGDITNATAFWGTAHADSETCKTTDSTTLADPRQTCNGNGDGFIGPSGAPDIPTIYERFRVWQHLANAGLIEGNYTGIAGPGGLSHSVIRQNVPGTKLANAGFSFWSARGVFDSVSFYPTAYGNTLYFGGQDSSSHTTGLVLRPEEAWNLDTKMDDGQPAYGKLLSQRTTGGAGACTTSATPSDAQYNLSDSSIACRMIVRTGV